MGRYMKVVLKDKYRNDLFIQSLNEELVGRYGANTWEKFNPWHCLQEQADYVNNHPEGKKQLPDWERPIAPERLSKNFFWLAHGKFYFKLSGGPTSDESRDAIAVVKWIETTKGKYIDRKASGNYDRDTVKQYLDYIMEEAGYDIEKLWQ